MYFTFDTHVQNVLKKYRNAYKTNQNDNPNYKGAKHASSEGASSCVLRTIL